MQEKIIHYWCDRCGAQYVPPQQDPKITLAILSDDKPSTQEFLGMDLCPACEKEFNELIRKFKSTTGNTTTSTPEKATVIAKELEPMGWEDWLEVLKSAPKVDAPPVVDVPNPLTPDWVPKCCKNCRNHPSNGGSGFCNCTLPYLEDSITTTPNPYYTNIATTSILHINPYGSIVHTGDSDGKSSTEIH